MGVVKNKTMSEKETIFVNGLRVSKPHENAPDFIKLNFGAKVDELVAFLQEHKKADGWVNFDLKKSKGGKLYLQLDTYQKAPSDSTQSPQSNDTVSVDDLPTSDPNAQAQVATNEEKGFEF